MMSAKPSPFTSPAVDTDCANPMSGRGLTFDQVGNLAALLLVLAIATCWLFPRKAARAIPDFLLRSRAFNWLLLLAVIGGWAFLVFVIAWLANSGQSSSTSGDMGLAYGIVLGALYLMAKPKIHPLWYTEFIPILFLVSSIFAGLSMVILEGSISHRVFSVQIDEERHASFEEILIGLAKGASIAMFAYYFFKALVFVHDKHWRLLDSFWGARYLLDVVGLTLVP